MTDKIMNDAIAAFGGAVTPIAPAQPEKKGSRPERERVELGEDLDHLAALSLVSKALADVAKVIGAEQKQKMLMEFAKRMFQYKTRPESFVGFGPRSEGYVQLSRKGSNAPLDEPTVKRLDELKVPYDKHETVPARLVINPEVLADQELLKALADAVKNAPGLQGVAVVLQQPEQFHYSTNDSTLDVLARRVETEEEAIDLLGRLAGVSIGKFQIDKLANPTELMGRALGIIKEAKLLVAGDEDKTDAGKPAAEVTAVAKGKKSKTEKAK